MDDTTQIQALVARLNISLSLATDYYADAKALVLDYTNQSIMIGNMAVYAKKLAIIAYNRDGIEGESQRTEGGVTNTLELGIPLDIRQALAKYRTASLGSFYEA